MCKGLESNEDKNGEHDFKIRWESGVDCCVMFGPNGVNRSRAFCYVGEMTGSLDQFVLIKASKNRGGEWSPDDYDVRDGHGKVVGRIMRHPQASKDQPWLWTIVAREIPPSVHNHGYSATREQAMADFKTRWAATTA